MSDVLYPIGALKAVAVSRQDRTLVDAFEDGTTTSRRFWAAQSFKRKVQLQHAPLTLQEFRYLRSFFSQRSGGYDYFWFRDNVNRGGNLKVRFTQPLPEQWDGGARPVAVELAEVGPIRALPEFDEIATAAGSAPLLWYDANREYYLTHAGTVLNDTSAYDVMLIQHPVWQAGTPPIGNLLGQYQQYTFTGAEWAKTAANLAGLSGSQPACTVFAIAKHGTIAARQVLFSVGAMGTSKAVGIEVNASNFYTPFLGGSETWAIAQQSNGTPNTWRSFAVTWAAASNSATFYTNAASIGSESNTRAYTAGPAALGAAIDGTLKASGNVAHALVFAGALTLAQVKAVHNLLGYQYGLAQV